MQQEPLAPNPISQQDADALIALLVILEIELISGELSPYMTERLRGSFEKMNLLAGGSGPAELRLALDNLNQRVRYLAGEYDEFPEPATGVADQRFVFPTLAAAQAFLAEARSVGERGIDPTESGDQESPWQVMVTSTELFLTPELDAHVARLRNLAGRHGGRHRGWRAPGSADAT